MILSRSWLENFLLLVRWQSAVQRNNHELADGVSEFLDFFSDRSARTFDFFLTCQEQQDVSFLFVLVNLNNSSNCSQQVITFGFWSVKDLNRVHSARNIEKRSSLEVLLESLSIKSCAHYHNF